jgi:YgiT-type zinc finger domain-containing protein
MHKEDVSSLQIINGQLTIIPDVPSLVCNHCQHTIHDPNFMEQVDQLLEQRLTAAGKSDLPENEKADLYQYLLWSQASK